MCYPAQIRGPLSGPGQRRSRAIPAKVFVGNLSFRTTKEELTEMLSAAGTVVDVYMPADRATGKPRGFAFVEFATEAEAERGDPPVQRPGRRWADAQAEPRRGASAAAPGAAAVRTARGRRRPQFLRRRGAHVQAQGKPAGHARAQKVPLALASPPLSTKGMGIVCPALALPASALTPTPPPHAGEGPKPRAGPPRPAQAATERRLTARWTDTAASTVAVVGASSGWR